MKIIIWIIIILAIIGVFIFTKKEAPEVSIAPLTLLKNTEIIVPDSDEVVKLTDGRGSYEIVPDSSSRGRVSVLDDMHALWGIEGQTDMAVILTSSTGGTGTFYYLVIFDVLGDVFTKKSEILLGDRIKITRVGIGELVHDPKANYRVTVQTLVRDVDEPFANEPKIPRTRTFYVTDQLLEEVEVGRDDT